MICGFKRGELLVKAIITQDGGELDDVEIVKAFSDN